MKTGIRKGIAALGVTAAVLTATATETSAAVVVRESSEFSDSGEDVVCGLAIEYDLVGRVDFMIREGRPGTPTEFWSWRISTENVLTNPENGKSIVVSNKINQRDVNATLIEDDVYLYRFQIAGQHSVVRDSNGRVVYRENGLLVFEVVFDHGAPQGERYLSFELVAERGFPGSLDDEELCAGFLELIG
jgi:hypothetical protein